ncbi:MAG: family 16 glycosylhydrolase [Chitinophagaceae bacterium]|nr:family 16 glycosylhydrolase [Chitinophagaceae bacterium]
MLKCLFCILLSFPVISGSCKKDKNPSGNSNPLSNLVITAVVSTDNSGNVAFTATATNAVSYDFDYGNGVSQTVSGGVITYQYLASGTFTINVTAKNSSGQTLSKSASVTVVRVMTLVWSDEFDVHGSPNAAKWGYDLGAGGWGNNELEYYTNRTDNAIVSGGTLKIILKAESYSGSAYTSARLLSKDKYSFKYGKVEARIKMPVGLGTWPAFWMLGANITTVGWPDCGEIDVMEHLGRQLNTIYGTVHHPGHSGGSADGGTTVISNATTEFHVYAAEWSATSIKFSVDGVVYFSFNNAAGLPFNQPFFIIMNVAMGGNFGGAVDPSFISSAMEVDYVRVYQ